MKYERELWGENGFAIIVLSLVSASDGVLGPRSVINFLAISANSKHFLFLTKTTKNQGRGVPPKNVHLNS